MKNEGKIIKYVSIFLYLFSKSCQFVGFALSVCTDLSVMFEVWPF